MEPVDAFLPIIEGFLRGHMTATAFSDRVIELHYKFVDRQPSPVNNVLDDLFIDADAFCDDPATRVKRYEIDEPELRCRTQRAYDKLLELKRREEKGRASFWRGWFRHRRGRDPGDV